MPFAVRASELNCRSGWTTDLWEPIEESGYSVGAAVGPGLDLSAGDKPRLPMAATVQPVADPSAAGAGDLAAGADGVDLLVEVSSSPRSTLLPPPIAPPSNVVEVASIERAPGAEQSERELIRRARDVHRLRLANRTRTAQSLGGDLAGDESAAGEGGSPPATSATDAALSVVESTFDRPRSGRELVGPAGPETAAGTAAPSGLSPGVAEALAARAAALGPVPPVPVTEMRTDLLGWGANRQEAEERFDSVPDIDPSFRLPFREKSNANRLRAGFDDGDLPAAEEAVADSTITSEPGPDKSPPEVFSPPVFAPESEAAPMDDPPPASPLRDGGAEADVAQFESQSWRVADRSPIGSAAILPSDWTGDSQRVAADRVSPSINLIRPEFDLDREADNLPDHHSPTDVRQGRTSQAAPRFDVQHPGPEAIVAPAWAGDEEEDDDVLEYPAEAWAALDRLADVPRCCRTCREFRPAEGGERGWCASAWAFQHRRMVHAEELPCQSAIGMWWLPSDDAWLDDLDVDHAHPTPLVDAMLARRTRTDRPAPRIRRRGRG